MVLEFGTTGIARAAAACGAQFVLFDQEHTGWSTETVRMLVAAGRAWSIVPLVRVPAVRYDLISRVLDVGALGIMAPMVESEAQARVLVESVKYPPLGRRGVGIMQRDELEPGGLAPTLEKSNRETLVIAQIESVAGLDEAEAIAAVDGIDVLWVGHNDLTTSLGVPGQFDHPSYVNAVDRLLAIATAHGKAVGDVVSSVDAGRAALARGFRIIAYGGDLQLYEDALRVGLASLAAERDVGPAPAHDLTV
jgi:2-keto-3-deoxy-L-rhamnonate aldolase RhmA